MTMLFFSIGPVPAQVPLLHTCAVYFLFFIFRHLKLELLTQFPASYDDKYTCFWKTDVSQIEQ